MPVTGSFDAVDRGFTDGKTFSLWDVNYFDDTMSKKRRM